jgi:DNA-binding MarR family transcriptional regulator
MTVNLESEIVVLRLWRQLYQTYTLLKQCEDRIIEEHGLTTEQYAILVSISYLGEPARITDIAHWLERSTNSISMIVDRMVKVGLVKRTRSKADRRVVYVAFTSKAGNAFKPSSRAMFETVREHMSPLSQKDKSTLLSLLTTLGHEILVCLNPEMDLEAVKKEETKQAASAKEWLLRYALPSAAESKRQGGEKKKTVRGR